MSAVEVYLQMLNRLLYLAEKEINMSDVIVMGTFVVDILLKGYDLKKICSDNICFLNSCSMNIGGNAGNVTIDLRKIGLKVQAIANISNDTFGKFILSEMQKYKVDISYMQFSQDTGTGVSIIFIEENGEKSILQYLGANTNLSFEEDLDENAKIVVITGLGLIPNIENNFEEITKSIKKLNKTIVVDTSANTIDLLSKISSNAFENIDYFLANEREVMDLTKMNDIESSAEYLLNLGCKNVIIKLGEKGAYFLNKEKQFYAPSVKTNVVDTTGAGDAFVSGLVYGLIHGYDNELCIKIANRVGSSCIEMIGSTQSVRL